jgi:hypothetical protein
LFIVTKEEDKHKRKGFEVLKALTVKITVVWDERKLCFGR